MPVKLKPFLNYFGSKYRTAKYYPAPRYPIVIEPFGGALGYSMNYPELDIRFSERDMSVDAAWLYLLTTNDERVLRLPILSRPDEDIRTWGLPFGEESLIAWNLSCGDPRPSYKLNGFAKKYRSPFAGHAKDGKGYENFWGVKRRARVARQVDSIRHWRRLGYDYRGAPDIEATWFIDPPYQHSGKHYIENAIDYAQLAAWCRSRRGQVIVCEQEGADWLPFAPFRTFKGGGHGRSKGKREVIWTS